MEIVNHQPVRKQRFCNTCGMHHFVSGALVPFWRPHLQIADPWPDSTKLLYTSRAGPFGPHPPVLYVSLMKHPKEDSRRKRFQKCQHHLVRHEHNYFVSQCGKAEGAKWKADTKTKRTHMISG